MPLIKSAIKRMKQTAKHRERNVAIKHDIKLATKAFMANPSSETLSVAQSELDKAVKKGLLKKATASRRKAALASIAKKADVKFETKAKKAPAKKPAAKKAESKAAKPATKAKAKAAKATSAKKTPAKKPAAKKTK